MMKTSFQIESAYTELLPELKSFIYRLTCDRAVTEDLAHDTFVRVIEKQGQFKGASSVRTWIFSIASNLAIDWLRGKKRWAENAQDEAKKLSESDEACREKYLQISQSSPAGNFDFTEHINFCFTCMSKTLPIEQQVTLILKDIYEFKVEEISRILKTPPGTVKHWLFVSRKAMTDIFDRRCALINKTGVCYQCSELNGLFNPRQPHLTSPFPPDTGKEHLYKMRTRLIRGIDPNSSKGSDLEDEIMKVLRRAIRD
jgi:RNA polymerase sigma-70 factor, ECF subfamily